MVILKLAPDVVAAEGIPLEAEDLRYGLEHGFVSANAVVDLAVEQVRRGAGDEVLHDLASLLRDEVQRVPEVLGSLDDPERIHDPRESVRKWLYLQLMGAYRERDRLSDPLAVVEQIYADFDYPSSMAPFVRYMPLRPGDVGGDVALMDRWAAFLTAEREELARSD